MAIIANLLSLVVSSPLFQVSTADNTVPTPTVALTTYAGCDASFTSDGYTTIISFDDCTTASVTPPPPPGFSPRQDNACTTYNGKCYCATGNCDGGYVSYYHTSVWLTSCSTNGCSFITEGSSIGFKCATTKTLDNGCLEIESKNWDAISVTTSCPTNAKPTK